MNILFVTFGRLSVDEGALRSIALLRATADAGHQVHVIAATADLAPHPNIQLLVANEDLPVPRRKLKLALLRAMGSKTYAVVHAVDDAVLHVGHLGKMKRTRIVYQPLRCFTGPCGQPPAWYWKWSPSHYQRVEKKILERSSIVFSSCDEMTADLKKLAEKVKVVQIEDIPSHPLFPKRDPDRHALLSCFEGNASLLIVCRVLAGRNTSELRSILLAVRKVIEKVPQAAFCFKGVDGGQAGSMAESLDIHRRCLFLSSDDHAGFLDALNVADAALFVPKTAQKYRHADIMTMLNSPALLVAVRNGAYASLLNEKNSVQVEFTATAIAEGLLRCVREPLLSFGLAAEAQTMVAQKYSFSSFKYKVRMAYHELLHV